MNHLIAGLYTAVTGKPWTTVRSATAEFGPTLATRYPELVHYSAAELIAYDRAELIARIEASRAAYPDPTYVTDDGKLTDYLAIAATRAADALTPAAARR